MRLRHQASSPPLEITHGGTENTEEPSRAERIESILQPFLEFTNFAPPGPLSSIETNGIANASELGIGAVKTGSERAIDLTAASSENR